MLGYAAISAPTVGSALQNLVELFHFHQQGTVMRLTERAPLLKLEYQIRHGRIVERRQDAELSLGMFLNIFKEAHGPYWAPEEVHFDHPRPAECQEHEKAFTAPVYFGQPINAILFRAEDLKGRMPRCDLRLLAILRTCLASLAVPETAADNVTNQIRTLLRVKLPEGYPPLESVAAELRTPVSAIQRRLAQEGTTYKDLVEQTRQNLAIMYLKQVHLSFSEIAFLLGYSELSAFSRFFRCRTGVSPREYRNRLLPRFGRGSARNEVG